MRYHHSHIVSFEIEDCELNVGPVSLGADWCIAIEGDGHEFEITHVWIEGKRADEWERSLAQRWFDGDLATGKLSRVRKAYEAAAWQRDPQADAAASRVDDTRHLLAAE